MTSDEEKFYRPSEVGPRFSTLKARRKLIHQLEQKGLVRKSNSLAQFSQSRAEAEKVGKSGKFWTLVDESERLLTWLLAKKKKKLFAGCLTNSLADDKGKQDQVLRILEVLCGQDILQSKS